MIQAHNILHNVTIVSDLGAWHFQFRPYKVCKAGKGQESGYSNYISSTIVLTSTVL